MKEHIGTHYDRTSLFQGQQFERLAGLVTKNIPDKTKIRTLIDIGCGSGGRTIKCLDIFPNLEHITAIDPDWEMIETAQKKYSDPRIQYVRMGAEDILKLAAENKKYDIAFSNWSVHWIEHKTKMMDDIDQVMNPGGYLAFSSSQTLPSILTMIDDYIRVEFRIPKGGSPFFHQRTAYWINLVNQHKWRILDVVDDVVHREVESAEKYLEAWFTSSATKAMYGKHLAELSSLSHSDLVFLMARAFPSNTSGMELDFTEDVMFMVAQK